MSAAELPAWSLPDGSWPQVVDAAGWPAAANRRWAFGDGRGTGVRVAVVDSGIDAAHPRVAGPVQRAVVVEPRDDGPPVVRAEEPVDVSGHGTACAGIIRSLAPDCLLTSVRVLGADLTGGGDVLLEGLRWAVRDGHDVVNLSLSTTKARYVPELHAIADEASFAGCLLVCSAHNMPVESYPWRFSSVLSVASHAEADPEAFFYNPDPPVEFHGRGADVEVAWTGGGTIVATGNSFATPHLSGLAARVVGAHPGVTPFQLKTLLHLSADNVAAGAR